MPNDKWGIPFLYPTKKTAGITNKGHGFFWQQHNDILDDDGMIRFGKELEDVEVINESTGEWEFPFLTDGDGLSMSGPTGHHTGGENHGCQGFAYMIDGEFEGGGAPRFRFRKETYHVEYDDHPSGSFTHPAATEVTSSEWKGMCWVRYNKKDGRRQGKDSVICEVWWNDDPSDDITKWVMLKRVEDKGDGITNWGVRATCDGDDYQVGTWSNIQFRFKSSASDFSIHPLIPESNDDPVVHSIGKEDMSFSEAEARGYGKRADMPRDIEMKCLFKWNGGGSGKCRFKNISLREIDPTLDFDSTPDDPEVPDQPTQTSRVKGTFTLRFDVNSDEDSACAITGITPFYNFLGTESVALIDVESNNFKTRVTAHAQTANSMLVDKIVKQLTVNLKKEGSPGATPVISAKIWDNDGNTKATSGTTIAPNSLSSGFTEQTFDFTSNTYTMQPGDHIGIEWLGTSETDYVILGIRESSGVDNSNTIYSRWNNSEETWNDAAAYDFGGRIYS